MSLVKFSNRVPSLFDRFFEDNLCEWSNRNYFNSNLTLPSVNVKESSDNYEVEMAVPGFNKEDFKLEVERDILTISSEKKVENETKEGQQYTKREFSYQSFSRSFTLPQSVDGDDIHATYDNGILRVRIPRKEEEKQKASRIIEIQ